MALRRLFAYNKKKQVFDDIFREALRKLVGDEPLAKNSVRFQALRKILERSLISRYKHSYFVHIPTQHELCNMRMSLSYVTA